jgi:hypothetical protein
MRDQLNQEMSQHQVRSWFGSVVPTVATHPAVQALAAKWFQIKAERDPRLADFWHDADEAFTDYVILFLKGRRDYTYLHHGRYLRDRIGFSMQGLMLGELRTRVRPQLMAIYDRAVSEFNIAYFQSFSDFQHEVMLWGRLCLPLRISADDERVAILLYCHPIEDKASIFKALFERSNSGIVIGAPIKNESGAIIDAWIVAQNEQASTITGIVEHRSADLLLRQTPLFARQDLWDHLVDRVAQRATVATVSDQSRGLTLSLYAELLDEYLVLRLTYLGTSPDVFLID